MFKYRIGTSEFSRNLITVFTGSTVAALIPILIMPIITRIYTVNDIGVYGIFVSIVTIIASIVTLRYELAILLPKSKFGANIVTNLALNTTIIFSIICVITAYIYTQIVHHPLMDIENPEIFVLLCFVAIILTAFYQIFTYLFNRHALFKNTSQNKVLQNLSMGFAQITLFSLSQSWSLLIGHIIGLAVTNVLLMKYSFKNNLWVYSLKKSHQLSAAKRYKNFALIDVPSVIFSTSASHIPNILFAAFYSPTVAGYYFLTQKVLQAPITLISKSVLEVFKEKAAKDYRTVGNAKSIFIKTFKLLLLISIPSTIFLFFSIEYLISFFFGTKWLESAYYAQILLPSLALRFISNPLSFMLYIGQKQQWNLIIMLIQFFSIIGAFLYFNDAISVIYAISASLSLTYFIHIVCAYKIAKGKL